MNKMSGVTKVAVGVSDMKVTNNPEYELITYGLASCAGITIYDPFVKVGGMLHVLLPDSKIAKRASDCLNPYKFVDTGVPQFFKSAYELGALKSRLVVSVVGCSSVMKVGNIFNIGQRNYAAIRKIFWKNNVIIDKEYCRTNESVTLSIKISTGEVMVKVGREQRVL